MIICSDNSIYTGITNDIARRWEQHATGKGAKYFRGRKPQGLIYLCGSDNRSEASKQEWALKQLSRKQKINLSEEHYSASKSLIDDSPPASEVQSLPLVQIQSE